MLYFLKFQDLAFMNIYVSHASSFDYHTQLYAVLRQSPLNQQHEFILPHEHSKAVQNSKELIREADLVLAEISYPSTGQGIELGWADLLQVPMICFHRHDCAYSSSIKIISERIFSYANAEDLIAQIGICLKAL